MDIQKTQQQKKTNNTTTTTTKRKLDLLLELSQRKKEFNDFYKKILQYSDERVSKIHLYQPAIS